MKNLLLVLIILAFTFTTNAQIGTVKVIQWEKVSSARFGFLKLEKAVGENKYMFTYPDVTYTNPETKVLIFNATPEEISLLCGLLVDALDKKEGIITIGDNVLMVFSGTIVIQSPGKLDTKFNVVKSEIKKIFMCK